MSRGALRGDFVDVFGNAIGQRASGVPCVVTSWQCVRVQSSGTALRKNFVATRGRCKVALSSVQIKVNVVVRVSKTLRATTQRNDLHVLCPSDACVQNGVKKQ